MRRSASYSSFRAAICVLHIFLLPLIVSGTTAPTFPETMVPLYAWAPNDTITMKVSKLSSIITQVPYDYDSIPSCVSSPVRQSSTNLGQKMLGENIFDSSIRIKTLVTERCRLLCSREVSAAEISKLIDRIEDRYIVNWYLDGLPVVSRMKGQNYQQGFFLGTTADNTVQLNNHITFVIHYEQLNNSRVGIVGFEALPDSIAHSTAQMNLNDPEGVFKTCPSKSTVRHRVELRNLKPGSQVHFTYSIEWHAEHDNMWLDRYDVYLAPVTGLEWTSIADALMIVVLLTGMVAVILVRILRYDVGSQLQFDRDDVQEETGWKVVHNDVFRPPDQRLLLAVLIGSGVQVFATALLLCLGGVLGMFTPADHGSLLFGALISFAFLGVLSGYFSAHSYKTMGGRQWMRNSLLTATLLPGALLFTYFLLCCFLWASKSSAGVGIGVWIILLLLLLLNAFLVALGSYAGFRTPVADPPVSTNLIPRLIPEQVWYMNPKVLIFVGGAIPFAAVFIELSYILSSLWLDQPYGHWTALTFVLLVLALSSAEIAIVTCYFLLCSEDYLWWWRAFLTPGCSAVYLFVYSIFFYSQNTGITSFTSATIYYLNMLNGCALCFVLTGSLGYFSCLYFLRRIYTSKGFQ